jgi:hypothetical protein
MEYWIIGKMLKEGLDVYVPLVDDFGIDAIVRRPNGEFVECQIKARSSNVIHGDAALFASIRHEFRKNYYFIFYSERIDTTWILSSEEFVKLSVLNKTGKNKGSRSVWFNGTRKMPGQSTATEYVKPQWTAYVATDFSKISPPTLQVDEHLPNGDT